MPNLRYTARGRPHNEQRRFSRVEYLGVRSDFSIFALLAMRSSTDLSGVNSRGNVNVCFAGARLSDAMSV